MFFLTLGVGRPPFQDIIGDLHNASLMIDDIEVNFVFQIYPNSYSFFSNNSGATNHHLQTFLQDNSKLRRGIPVAHSIFGIPSVINAANYAYFLALEKVHALENPEAMKVRFADWMSFGMGYIMAAVLWSIVDDSYFGFLLFSGICWRTLEFA
jgi:hypothetical protein